MKIKYIIIPMAAAMLIVGCKQQSQPTQPQQPKEVVLAGSTDTVELELEPAKPTKQRNQNAQNIQNTQNTQKQPSNKTAETIYVETDGAQGRVWGHVTMRGDRGTGTIHDWDENTLAVSVTRHGDELFAVDQNSRQYVFKLKK